MSLPRQGGDWRSLAGYVVLSLALYLIGAIDALFFLFAVPLQVLYLRKGRRQFLAASGLTLVGVALFSLWRTGSLAAGGLRTLLMCVEVGAALLIVAGLYVVNADWPLLQRRLYRLLAATIGTGIVSLPLVVMLARNSAFNTLMQNQVQQVLTMLSSSFGGGNSSVASGQDVARLTAYIRQTVLSNYVLAYFVMLTMVWRIGTLFALRSALTRPAPLARFGLPVGFLWPTLILWAAVLANRMLHLGAVGDAAWNLAMVGAFLYGLQGIGVVQFLFARYNVARGFRFLLVVVVLILLFIPGVATIVLLAFPILGISELWIRYGREANR